MIAMLIVAWIVFIIVWKLLKATVSNALTLAAILILLNISFGITPQDIWQYITQFAQNLSQIQIGK
ncbi:MULTISPECIES: hypothetical protein [unclassified Nostoc]|uniref:hypothetical protein n=1 Tax=unclassified Nostoc TaxID=2593658 RepID=UPI00083DAB6D|nr:hypothetical protein [Nostoc sp. KVJ20]ODH00449.1 hypothetical protein A4S05_33210 [Nostoc sp. KVJ20]